jgi:dTDP-4-dehydrorhamnose reductase
MKILLTGSNGMLGSSLAEKLSQSAHQIWATGKGECRLPSHLFHTNFHYQSLDITQKEEVEDVIKSIKPDTIIHSAALTQVDDCEQNKSLCYSINVDGTRHLLASAEDINSRFCLISTDFVFSGEDGPYAENDATGAVNYYGQTKELAEQLVMASRLNWSIARTILLYGKAEPSKRSNFIYWVKQNLEAGKQIKVVNDQIRTPTYIPDLVNGISLIINKGARGIFHLSGKDILTPYQMAVLIAKHLNLNETLLEPVDASTFTQLGIRPLKTGFMIDRAVKELGYEATAFEKALSLIF